MRWLAESTRNRIGARSFVLTISTIRPASTMASSTPSGCPCVMPSTWIGPPSGSVASPAITAPVALILRPFGNMPARMSSSVIGILPVGCRAKKCAGRKCGNLGRLPDAERLPDIDGVLGLAKTLQPSFETLLLGLENLGVASSGYVDRVNGRLAKRHRFVVDEDIGTADEIAV